MGIELSRDCCLKRRKEESLRSPRVASLPSFDLSRLLIGHAVLSSLAALYSNEVPQWNIPLALYGLVVVQSVQVTSESLSTFLLLFGGSLFLDAGRLVFGGSFQFFFFLNFLLKPLTLLTTLTQLRQTSDSNSFGNGGGMGDRILNATSGFPPFGHRQGQPNETVWSAPPTSNLGGGGGGVPGSYQQRFSLDDETARDLEQGNGAPSSTTTADPLKNSSRSAPPTVQTSNQKGFGHAPTGAKKSGSAAEGGGYHTLE
ncbi:hypothetical protein JCM16303_001869 [Sporobolomyces ruberrimus]